MVKNEAFDSQDTKPNVTVKITITITINYYKLEITLDVQASCISNN